MDRRVVTARVQRGNERNRHNLGVAQMILRIVTVMERVHHVIAYAIDCYNVDVHTEGFLAAKFEHLNSSTFCMDLAR